MKGLPAYGTNVLTNVLMGRINHISLVPALLKAWPDDEKLRALRALDRLDLGVAVTIEFLGPIGLAAILSRKPLHYLGVLLAGVGVLLLAAPWAATTISPLGAVFAAGAGLVWALYIVLAQRAGAAFEGFDGLGLGMVFATLVVLVPGVVGGGSELLSPHILLIGLAAGFI